MPLLLEDNQAPRQYAKADSQLSALSSQPGDPREQVGRRIGRNSVYMVVRTVLIMLVSLYTSRLALELLGETDYGIYSLVAGFVIFFGFLNISMERSITRFLMYEKGRGEAESLRKMFNVAMMTQFCIVGVVLLAGETIGLWYVNTHLNIPPGRMEATNWVYQLSLLTLCFNIVKVPYNAMIVAFEKLSFYAAFSLGEVLVRLGCILALLLLHDHLLIIYSAQFLAVTVVVVSVYKLYRTHARCFGGVCRFYGYWNGAWFRQMLLFCGWSTLGSAACLGAFQGVSLILNRFFGVAINAAFGLAAQVQQASFSVLVSFQTAFSPKLVALYAQNRLPELRTFIYKLGKYSFYIAAFVLVPVCVNIDVALRIWLGPEVPEFTGIFCVLCMASNGVDCLAAPGLVCNQATGRVKWFNIVWSALMIANLPIVYGLLQAWSWAPAAFFVRVTINLLCYAFFAYMMHRQIGLSAWRYVVVSLLKPALLLLPALAAAIALKTVMGITLLSALANTFLFWVVMAVPVYAFGLDAAERATVRAKLHPGRHTAEPNIPEHAAEPKILEE